MNPFTATLKISPVFSKSLFLTLVMLSLTAAIVVMSLPLNFLIKFAGCLVIFAWLVMVLREHCWHGCRAIQTVTLRSDNTWFVFLEGSERIKVDLLPGCLVLPWLTVLHFRMPDRRKKSLIMLRDNVDVVCFRRLRVRLKNSG